MKTVTLKQPTTVQDVLRHPIEGALIVSDAEAERLFDNGLLDGKPEDVAEEDAQPKRGPRKVKAPAPEA